MARDEVAMKDLAVVLEHEAMRDAVELILLHHFTHVESTWLGGAAPWRRPPLAPHPACACARRRLS